jgi:hypothetical protein
VHSTGGGFSLYTGFWTPETLAPTAATAIAGGRVTTTAGKGIRNVLITMIFPNGDTRTMLSGANGVYNFADVPTGETYIFSASAKRYVFNQNSQVRTINDDAQDINFVGETSFRPDAQF